LEQLLEEEIDLAVIGYHINDAYTNNYGVARADYYGMVGFPHIVLDGQQLFEFAYDDILEAYEERILESSHYSIELEVERYGAWVNVSVNVGQIGAPNPETKVLHLVVTESHIPESWYGGDEVNHAQRLMIPDHNGTPIIGDLSFDFEFEMDPNWLLQNCELIAFVQDVETIEVVQTQVFLLEETVLNNDVAIDKIIYPGEEYCLDMISPVIQIQNFGADTLFSCEIHYTINDESYVYDWIGNMGMYQVEQVQLPQVPMLVLEENALTINIELPNGQEDEYPENNQLEHTFENALVISEPQLKFELQTDQFGEETSWVLLNSSDQIIYQGEGYESSTYYSFDWELEENDCYSFVVYDSGGNGICCETGFGYYKIKDSDDEVIFIGGNFQEQKLHMFNLDMETGRPNDIPFESIKIFPNPSSEHITIESEGNLSSYVLTDIQGRIWAAEVQLSSHFITIDLSSLINGLYFIRVTENGTQKFYKIVKE
jgi:hypothetical protein